MFIVSKKNFVIRRPAGGTYRIGKDWAGELPEDVAKSWLVQAAIRSGSIIASPSAKDKDMAQAEEDAEQKAQEADIRPDAQETATDGETDEKKTSRDRK